MPAIEIGRLLRASTTGFIVGCQVSQLDAPSFGALVRVPLDNGYQIYGLIYDIHIDDDGLVRQLVTAGSVEEAVIADNRLNRNIPIEMSVVATGFEEDGRIRHLLPPRPPLSLDLIYLCDAEEVRRFTGTDSFGYLRHVLRSDTAPVDELLAAHLQQAAIAHRESGEMGWPGRALNAIVTLLHDDYPRLMQALMAVSESAALDGSP